MFKGLRCLFFILNLHSKVKVYAGEIRLLHSRALTEQSTYVYLIRGQRHCQQHMPFTATFLTTNRNTHAIKLGYQLSEPI